MKLAGRIGWAAAIAAIALVVLLVVPKLSTSRALAIWVVLVAALALAVLARQARAGDGPERASRFERALRQRQRPSRQPLELLRMERELLLGTSDADHAHRRLLPLLRATATARLAARHELELERRPEAARALLGDEAWELLRPDRPEPEDRHGRGVPRKSIELLIERVEEL